MHRLNSAFSPILEPDLQPQNLSQLSGMPNLLPLSPSGAFGQQSAQLTYDD